MLFTVVVLIACGVAAGLVLRAALIVLQVRLLAEERPLELTFTVRPVSLPKGERMILAVGAERWRLAGMAPAASPAAVRTAPAAGNPAAAGSAGGTGAVAAGGLAGLWRDFQRLLMPPAARKRIAGREPVARGTFVLSDRRVRFRTRDGRADVDVPLTDVAHLEVRAPLLEVRRRSDPTPLIVRVPQAPSVAQLVHVLQLRASGATVRVVQDTRTATLGRRP